MKTFLMTLIFLVSAATLSAREISGVYKTEWGDLTLSQQGANVTGTYPHSSGRIEGTLYGHVLTGYWHQTNGSGRIRFEFNKDFSAFAGKWGRGEAEPAGSWNGTRIR